MSKENEMIRKIADTIGYYMDGPGGEPDAADAHDYLLRIVEILEEDSQDQKQDELVTVYAHQWADNGIWDLDAMWSRNAKPIEIPESVVLAYKEANNKLHEATIAVREALEAAGFENQSTLMRKENEAK